MQLTNLIKGTSIRLIWLCLTAVLPLFAHALVHTDVTIGQLKYDLDDETLEATVKGFGANVGNGSIRNLVIPESVSSGSRSYTVTTIGYKALSFSGAFANRLSGSLTLPESLKTIEAQAFSGSSSLTGSLIIPNSVTFIGRYAFSECSGFNGTLTIGENVTTIEENAFYLCSGFTGSLTIPESVIKIGQGAFRGCSSLTGFLTIGNSVKTIECSAFHGCSGFNGTLTIGKSVETIKLMAFYNCKFSEIFSYAAVPPALGENGSYLGYSFDSSQYSKPLYVPAGSIDLYRDAYEWENFLTIQPIIVQPATISLNITEKNILVGDHFSLTAVILPDDASQEVIWSTSDSSIATVSADGEVSAINPGTALITATTTDDSELSASCEVKAWLKGDANGDNVVDVADVVTTINYAAGKEVETFIKIAAYFDGDGEITTNDAVLIAEYITDSLTSNTQTKVASDRASAYSTDMDYLKVVNSGNKFVISLIGNGFSAFQTDIRMPEGAELTDIALTETIEETHTLIRSKEIDGMVRIMVYSLENAEFDGNGTPLVDLTFAGDTTGLEVLNAKASTLEGQSRELGVEISNVPTSVDELSAKVSVIGVNNGIAVRGGEGETLRIYSSNGQEFCCKVLAAKETVVNLPKGIYIIVVGETTDKIAVR
ncbi:MAG: leucine-rich repeat protein [Bacteroidales bacterium]|nr:leucine-rich repeat protein [Bacteroidales bacterium]